LNEDVPDCPGSTRSTALGKELKFDLWMAFVGTWDTPEIPRILEKYGYIDEAQAEAPCTGSLVRWSGSCVATFFKHIFNS
jgi:hypothetical protein